MSFPVKHLSPEGPRFDTSSRSPLEVSGLTKRYGAIVAVDDISFSVRKGEILGFIGPNGAGKTTLFEVVSGFVRPDAGRVVVAGRDVGHLSAEARGRLGLIRSFQDSWLYPTMTALDALQLAGERAAPTRLVPAIAGMRGQDKQKEAQAREVAGLFGLDSYRNHRIRELSTGTRRICELACLVILRPSLLLLDEPSSGIAQRETEALGPLLRDLKDYLDATLLVIEHDMPLIMGLSDRIIAMSAGKIIAEAAPAVIQHDPRVVESYLGIKAARQPIGPSLGRDQADDRCRAITRARRRCSRRAGPDGLCHIHRESTTPDRAERLAP